MCLLYALVEMEPGKFDIEKVAEWYKKWVISKPFDLEQTIGGTLQKFAD